MLYDFMIARGDDFSVFSQCLLVMRYLIHQYTHGIAQLRFVHLHE